MLSTFIFFSYFFGQFLNGRSQLGFSLLKLLFFSLLLFKMRLQLQFEYLIVFLETLDLFFQSSLVLFALCYLFLKFFNDLFIIVSARLFYLEAVLNLFIFYSFDFKLFFATTVTNIDVNILDITGKHLFPSTFAFLFWLVCRRSALCLVRISRPTEHG